jgi:hypothetical protein
MNPLQIKPSAQSVWPVVGQEILNADVGGNFQIQITSGFFQIWRAGCNNSTTTLVWISNVRVNVIRWMVPLP